jgi:hypothetical protein
MMVMCSIVTGLHGGDVAISALHLSPDTKLITSCALSTSSQQPSYCCLIFGSGCSLAICNCVLSLMGTRVLWFICLL